MALLPVRSDECRPLLAWLPRKEPLCLHAPREDDWDCACSYVAPFNALEWWELSDTSLLVSLLLLPA